MALTDVLAGGAAEAQKGMRGLGGQLSQIATNRAVAQKKTVETQMLMEKQKKLQNINAIKEYAESYSDFSAKLKDQKYFAEAAKIDSDIAKMEKSREEAGVEKTKRIDESNMLAAGYATAALSVGADDVSKMRDSAAKGLAHLVQEGVMSEDDYKDILSKDDDGLASALTEITKRTKQYLNENYKNANKPENLTTVEKKQQAVLRATTPEAKAQAQQDLEATLDTQAQSLKNKRKEEIRKTQRIEKSFQEDAVPSMIESIAKNKDWAKVDSDLGNVKEIPNVQGFNDLVAEATKLYRDSGHKGDKQKILENVLSNFEVKDYGWEEALTPGSGVSVSMIGTPYFKRKDVITPLGRSGKDVDDFLAAEPK